MTVEFLTAEEAVKRIDDGATIATGGFVCVNVPEEVEEKLGERFLNEGHPKDLTLYYAAGQGDGKDRSLNHLGHEGMIKRVVGGHWNLVPQMGKMALENKIEAYNLPQGVITHMYRDAASRKPGTYTKVGLKTFVDPDLDGGKLNDISKEDIVTKINLAGEDFLFYKTPKLDVVLLRGTYADELGNISMEHEGAILDATTMATACRNNGGLVIVQVKEVVEEGSLDPKLVKIPNTLVDIVVPTSDVEKYHQQAFDHTFSPYFSGQHRTVLGSMEPMALNNRKVIGRRGAMMMKSDWVVNLGIGIPEAVGSVVNEEGEGHKMTLTVESGIHGGVPAGGGEFGMAINPYIIFDQDKQFDFYDGGGLDITYLGLAQCDKKGNINVSKFGPRIAGCGGFINISQNTKNVVFCGTFTAGGLKQNIGDGKLEITQEGKMKKFVEEVEQVTFSAEYANETGQNVFYITERAVFKLTPKGLLLLEIAPGMDLQKDILDQMEFEPEIAEDLKEMDPSLFKDEKIGLCLE
ncbi:MAG: acyl CoA:acetate/3-ketoacid CoA transferase [Tissierellia bacterium]|nr:acyl CoA:acetate/3-ketoacid CoA transferase [Tissierellia bacterium]